MTVIKAKDETLMIQCKLQEVFNHSFQTSWVAEDLAMENVVLNLKGDNDEWSRWRVVEIYDNVKLPYKVIRERGEDYKQTRKASDI